MCVLYADSTMTIESHFGGDIYPDDVEIVLDDVRCYGNESRLIDCFHAGLGLENCNGNELAGVVCKGSYDNELCTLLKFTNSEEYIFSLDYQSHLSNLVFL